MYRTARFVVGYSHDPTIGPDVRQDSGGPLSI